jgi:hypothetical protein
MKLTILLINLVALSLSATLDNYTYTVLGTQSIPMWEDLVGDESDDYKVAESFHISTTTCSAYEITQE